MYPLIFCQNFNATFVRVTALPAIYDAAIRKIRDCKGAFSAVLTHTFKAFD